MPLTIGNGITLGGGLNFNIIYGPSSPYWIATLSGASTDRGFGVAIDTSGNIYIAGTSSTSGGAGLNDWLIAKYDSFGSLLWQRFLGTNQNDACNGIAVDSSGNVYVVGYLTRPTTFETRAIIAKYDSSGTLQWQRQLGGTTSSHSEQFNGVAVDGSGNIYAAGSTNTTTSGVNDVLVAKYDTNGNLTWQRVLGGTGQDEATCVAADASGNVYIGGTTFSAGAGSQDMFAAKWNSSGTLQWQRVLGGTGIDSWDAIAVDSSENVYLTGSGTSQGAGSADLFVAKYNTSGTIQWQRRLGGASFDRGKGIAVDSSGNSYIFGTGASQTAGSSDGLLVAYNTSGTLLWQRRFGGTTADNGQAITVNNSGIMYFFGYTTSSTGSGDDMLLVSAPTSGGLTGAYSPFTYVATTLTSATSTLTGATPSLTSQTGGLTASTPSMSNTASNLTSSLVVVQSP